MFSKSDFAENFKMTNRKYKLTPWQKGELKNVILIDGVLREHILGGTGNLEQRIYQILPIPAEQHELASDQYKEAWGRTPKDMKDLTTDNLEVIKETVYSTWKGLRADGKIEEPVFKYGLIKFELLFRSINAHIEFWQARGEAEANRYRTEKRREKHFKSRNYAILRPANRKPAITQQSLSQSPSPSSTGTYTSP